MLTNRGCIRFGAFLKTKQTRANGQPMPYPSSPPAHLPAPPAGRLLATPRQQAAATPSRVPPLFTNQAQASHPSDRRPTVASASPAALTARPRSLLGRIRSLNACQNPTSFEVEASSVSTTACTTPRACGSTTAGPAAAPGSPTHHPEPDQAAADSLKQPAAVALGQPCAALVLAPTVKAIILAQPPMGARQLASLPFCRGPTLDIELSPEEVGISAGLGWWALHSFGSRLVLWFNGWPGFLCMSAASMGLWQAAVVTASLYPCSTAT